MEFNENKHGYILTFPWNFEEVISEYEHGHRTMEGYWPKFMVNTGSVNDFNNLFREFH